MAMSEIMVAAIDQAISNQLNEIMHNERFGQLEGSWRGLHYLVMNSETSTNLKLRVINLPKRELFRDLTRAVEFDQSQLFKQIYENEFGTPGGEPYGALIGDYEWTNHPDDIDTLRLISNVAAASFSPFISAAGASMFGMESWTELSKPRDIAKLLQAVRPRAGERALAIAAPYAAAVMEAMGLAVERLDEGDITSPTDAYDVVVCEGAVALAPPGWTSAFLRS